MNIWTTCSSRPWSGWCIPRHSLVSKANMFMQIIPGAYRCMRRLPSFHALRLTLSWRCLELRHSGLQRQHQLVLFITVGPLHALLRSVANAYSTTVRGDVLCRAEGISNEDIELKLKLDILKRCAVQWAPRSDICSMPTGSSPTALHLAPSFAPLRPFTPCLPVLTLSLPFS